MAIETVSLKGKQLTVQNVMNELEEMKDAHDVALPYRYTRATTTDKDSCGFLKPKCGSRGTWRGSGAKGLRRGRFVPSRSQWDEHCISHFRGSVNPGRGTAANTRENEGEPNHRVTVLH